MSNLSSICINILLFSSVLFPNPSPELSFANAGIQYGDFE